MQRRKPFKKINKMNESDVRYFSKLISREHPQTIALVSSFLEVHVLKIILTSLHSDLMSEVMMRMVKIDEVSHEVIFSIEKILLNKMKESKNYRRFEREDNVLKLRDVIDEMPTTDIRGALKAINQIDEEIFDELTTHIAEKSPEKLI